LYWLSEGKIDHMYGYQRAAWKAGLVTADAMGKISNFPYSSVWNIALAADNANASLRADVLRAVGLGFLNTHPTMLKAQS
jgi:hypothetical protein